MIKATAIAAMCAVFLGVAACTPEEREKFDNTVCLIGDLAQKAIDEGRGGQKERDAVALAQKYCDMRGK